MKLRAFVSGDNNVVDGLFAIAGAIHALADAVTDASERQSIDTQKARDALVTYSQELSDTIRTEESK